MVLGVSATCCMAGAASEVAIEQQLDEHVVCQDLLGELLNSLLWNAKRSAQSGEKVTTSVHQHQTKVINVRVLSRA